MSTTFQRQQISRRPPHSNDQWTPILYNLINFVFIGLKFYLVLDESYSQNMSQVLISVSDNIHSFKTCTALNFKMCNLPVKFGRVSKGRISEKVHNSWPWENNRGLETNFDSRWWSVKMWLNILPFSMYILGLAVVRMNLKKYLEIYLAANWKQQQKHSTLMILLQWFFFFYNCCKLVSCWAICTI